LECRFVSFGAWARLERAQAVFPVEVGMPLTDRELQRMESGQSQLTLFDSPRKARRVTVPGVVDTSRDAADLAEASAGSQMAAVLDVIRAAGERGATADEVEAAMGICSGAASARINRLAELRLIWKHGDRRPTRRGGTAYVWRAVVK
jgi:hypothetical protein